MPVGGFQSVDKPQRGIGCIRAQIVRNGVVHVLASQLPASAASQSDFTTARNTAVLVH